MLLVFGLGSGLWIKEFMAQDLGSRVLSSKLQALKGCRSLPWGQPACRLVSKHPCSVHEGLSAYGVVI